jgi:SAM-dependent methyltransferase
VKDLDQARAAVSDLYEKVKIIVAAFTALEEGVPWVEASDGAYHYIPVDISDYLQSLLDLECVLKNDPDYKHSDLPYRPCSFLEVGCGTGRNVFLLKHAERFRFSKIVGFDIAEPYVEHGRRIFGLGDDVFVDDCMTFDYGGFDVIHFYRPFSDDEQESAFEKHLVDTMKRSAFVIGHLDHELDKSRLLMRVHDSTKIWKRL